MKNLNKKTASSLKKMLSRSEMKQILGGFNELVLCGPGADGLPCHEGGIAGTCTYDPTRYPLSSYYCKATVKE